MTKQIVFNIPHLTGKEAHYMYDAVSTKKISGNGKYTQLCHQYFEERYGFAKCLLTTSCTDALEMAAILIDIKPGDEVIMPSYTFVSTANAFVLRGANIIFADSEPDNPNIDASKIEKLVTSKTKAIVPVHYAGVACDMDKIMELSDKYKLFVIEDAAQAIDSFYKGKPLGSIGHLSAFSFHETKNIISGEGGMLVVNDERFADRAEIIWEKGTNRAAFWRGEVDKYGWVDVGSSFLPSEITAAFLFAQLNELDNIQTKRKTIWDTYRQELKALEGAGKFILPNVPGYATNNGHMFYLVLPFAEERSSLIDWLRKQEIHAVFHYLSLHKSEFYEGKHKGDELVNSDRYSDNLIRLPLFYDLSDENINRVIGCIKKYYLRQR
jgi:dTDP-4-amino-4,6-dideoxygalactose transaminase